MENIVDILLVEDSPRDAELTLMALQNHNMLNNIIHVWDGVEALDFLFAKGKYSERDKNFQPKVILLDLKLPRLSGLDVLKEIKKDPLTQNIPVVILTSSGEEKDIINSYGFGVNSYIVKPVKFDKFVESVQEIGYYWMLLNKPPIIK